MSKLVTYEVLKTLPKNTLFFINEITDVLLIKVSDAESKFFTYIPFFNFKKHIFSEENLSKRVRVNFNKFMNSKTYIILEKEDLNELAESFNYLNEYFVKYNSYTLH